MCLQWIMNSCLWTSTELFLSKTTRNTHTHSRRGENEFEFQIYIMNENGFKLKTPYCKNAVLCKLKYRVVLIRCHLHIS